jgi:hypothetical protein
MTPAQYKAAIAKLGFSQQKAGVWLGLCKKTGQNYAVKGPPEPVAKLLRLILSEGIDPQKLK